MSDDNVVTFKGNKKEDDDTEYLLVCTKCDNRTFTLFAGGKIECAFCDAVITSADEDDHRVWREVVGDPASGDEVRTEAGDTETTRTHMNSIPFARASVVKTVSNWATDEKLAMLVGYNLKGEGKHWLDINTEEQREWVVEKLESLKEFVLTASITSPTMQEVTPSDD